MIKLNLVILFVFILVVILFRLFRENTKIAIDETKVKINENSI